MNTNNITPKYPPDSIFQSTPKNHTPSTHAGVRYQIAAQLITEYGLQALTIYLITR